MVVFTNIKDDSWVLCLESIDFVLQDCIYYVWPCDIEEYAENWFIKDFDFQKAFHALAPHGLKSLIVSFALVLKILHFLKYSFS